MTVIEKVIDKDNYNIAVLVSSYVINVTKSLFISKSYKYTQNIYWYNFIDLLKYISTARYMPLIFSFLLSDSYSLDNVITPVSLLLLLLKKDVDLTYQLLYLELLALRSSLTIPFFYPPITKIYLSVIQPEVRITVE